jgi:hypothetical protein
MAAGAITTLFSAMFIAMNLLLGFSFGSYYGFPLDCCLLLFVTAGIIAIIVSRIVSNWLGYKSVKTSSEYIAVGPYWGEKATFWETINPKPEYFGDKEKIRETAAKLIIMGIIAIPGSLVVGGLFLAIAGIRMSIAAKP